MEADHEIIDLTGDSDDEDAQPVAGPSNLRPLVPAEEDEVQLDFFCQGEDKLPLLEGLRILNVGEIKSLCKTLKIQILKMTVRTSHNLCYGLLLKTHRNRKTK
jgi:hypothetical protein